MCIRDRVRAFGLIFLGRCQPMTERSPEVLWPMSFPTLVLTGLALHLPLLLAHWDLISLDWLVANGTIAAAVAGSTLVGVGLGLAFYGRPTGQPVTIVPKPIADFFAYDLYTAQLYKATIVLSVGLVSNVIYWVDRFIVDGFINVLGALTIFGGQGLRYNTSGQTQFYALSILLSIVLFGLLVTWPLLVQVGSIATP